MKEVIVLNKSGKSQILLKELQKEFHPEITYLVSANLQKIGKIAPFTKEYQPIEDKTTIYICENFVCNKPTTDITKALGLLS